MTWIFIGLVVVVVAAVAAVAVGHGDGLATAPPDRPEVAVPAHRRLTAADLADVGLSVGLRGYRMDEVDDLLARLGTEISERDALLAARGPAAPATAAEPVPAGPPDAHRDVRPDAPADPLAEPPGGEDQDRDRDQPQATAVSPATVAR